MSLLRGQGAAQGDLFERLAPSAMRRGRRMIPRSRPPSALSRRACTLQVLPTMLSSTANASVDLAVHSLALCAALKIASSRYAHEAAAEALSSAHGASKEASRRLRSALALLAGDADLASADGCDLSLPPHLRHHGHSVLDIVGYAQAALAAFYATVTTAFHEKSYWTAAALLDVCALWAVWRSHKHAHAEAAAAASLRRAAADPANPATHCVKRPGSDELTLLQAAAAHSKAAYGAFAANGDVSSALGYLQLVTVRQATRRAPRHIPPTAHLAGLQQLTGVPPCDVLAAQWTAHLHRPAFYAAVDRRRRLIVVCLRGTLQLGDYCTVLDAVPQPATLCGVSGHVHGGFMAAARNLLGPVSAALQEAAKRCPGWPVLLTGHSLGGGVAAVLTMLLVELRERWEAQQHWQQRAPAGAGGGGEAGGEQPMWRQLGELRCIGVGAAAAFCEKLGMACKQHVTSVLYGADCLPMFSVLGARLLIEEVHAKSKAAAAVGSLLRRTPILRRWASSGSSSSSDGGSSGGSSPRGVAGLARLPSASSSVASGGAAACEALCGGGACRGLCRSLSASDSVCELAEAEAEARAAANGAGAAATGRLHRSSSTWSTASTASIAAFASEALGAAEGGSAAGGTAGAGAGAALVPMFPPGRILWLLPPAAGPGSEPGSPTAAEEAAAGGQPPAAAGAAAGAGSQGGSAGGGAHSPAPQLVETDQSAFERFLFTTETATVHLPDWYIDALSAVAGAS